MYKKTRWRRFLALAVCAACLAGCNGGREEPGTGEEPEGSGPLLVGDLQAANNTVPDGMTPPLQPKAPHDPAAPTDPSGTYGEEWVFCGRVVSMGDAVYTAELQMDGVLVPGEQADLEQWQALSLRTPDALYIDGGVDTGFDLTQAQMEAVLSVLRGIELELYTDRVETADLTADAYTVTAVDEAASVMWKLQFSDEWVIVSFDDVLRVFDSGVLADTIARFVHALEL